MAKTDENMAAAQEGKLKALQAAMAKIEKDFGKGSIMKLGDEKIENVEVIPTGSIALNAALGVGGYPKGRIIEIYGPESSGKTTPPSMPLPNARRPAALRLSSMQSMPSTASMPRNSVWTSTTCGFRSLTMASRLLRLPTS